MRHQKTGKKLGRNSSHRKAMFRNMATSLFKHEQLVTTNAKAKELRPIAEKMISLAKRGDLHARRQALSYLKDKTVTHRLFEEIKDRYLDRQGGYIRIIKQGMRKGDGASVSIVQLLPVKEGRKAGKKKAPARKKAAKKSSRKKPVARKKAAKKVSKKKPASRKKAAKKVTRKKPASRKKAILGWEASRNARVNGDWYAAQTQN